MSVPDHLLDPDDTCAPILDADGQHDVTECRCWDCRAYWISVLADERYDLKRGN